MTHLRRLIVARGQVEYTLGFMQDATCKGSFTHTSSTISAYCGVIDFQGCLVASFWIAQDAIVIIRSCISRGGSESIYSELRSISHGLVNLIWRKRNSKAPVVALLDFVNAARRYIHIYIITINIENINNLYWRKRYA
jgi:hypothetical protein